MVISPAGIVTRDLSAQRHFNHLFHCHTKLGINLCLVAAMNAAQHEFGAAANEAFVFIAPLDQLHVARRLLFYLLACHKFNWVQYQNNIIGGQG